MQTTLAPNGTARRSASRPVTVEGYRRAYDAMSRGGEVPSELQLAAFLSTTIDEVRAVRALLAAA